MLRASFRRDTDGAVHQLRDRRGVTLVVVALLVVVIFGFTAFAIDLGRAYLFKAQLQTATDAAALSAAVEIRDRTPLNAVARVNESVTYNRVETRVPIVESITPGTWDDDIGFTAEPTGDWEEPRVNAVQVIARHPMDYTFGRVFGVTSLPLRTLAVATSGASAVDECMKPWAVPFSVLAWAAGRANVTDITPLTPEEVAYLADNQKSISIKIGSKGEGAIIDEQTGVKISGNFRAVAFPGMSGGDDYRRAIADRTCENRVNLGIGDMLTTEPGNMIGPTSQGMKELCGGTGNSGVCSPYEDVSIPIWDDRPEKAGRTEVEIRYVGAFSITHWDKDGIYGFLTAFSTAGSGGFQNAPGPVTVTALVQ